MTPDQLEALIYLLKMGGGFLAAFIVVSAIAKHFIGE